VNGETDKSGTFVNRGPQQGRFASYFLAILFPGIRTSSAHRGDRGNTHRRPDKLCVFKVFWPQNCKPFRGKQGVFQTWELECLARTGLGRLDRPEPPLALIPIPYRVCPLQHRIYPLANGHSLYEVGRRDFSTWLADVNQIVGTSFNSEAMGEMPPFPPKGAYKSIFAANGRFDLLDGERHEGGVDEPSPREPVPGYIPSRVWKDRPVVRKFAFEFCGRDTSDTTIVRAPCGFHLVALYASLNSGIGANMKANGCCGCLGKTECPELVLFCLRFPRKGLGL